MRNNGKGNLFKENVSADVGLSYQKRIVCMCRSLPGDKHTAK